MSIKRTEENRKIKKLLKQSFPTYKISVTQGKGTACGWKHIYIDTDIKEKKDENDAYKLSREVTDKFDGIRKQAEQIARQNAELYHYTQDDGYNTESEVYLISVKVYHKRKARAFRDILEVRK